MRISTMFVAIVMLAVLGYVILMAGMRVIKADQRNQQNSLVEAIR